MSAKQNHSRSEYTARNDRLLSRMPAYPISDVTRQREHAIVDTGRRGKRGRSAQNRAGSLQARQEDDALMRGVRSPTRMMSAWCHTLNHTSSTHTRPIRENAMSCKGEEMDDLSADAPIQERGGQVWVTHDGVCHEQKPLEPIPQQFRPLLLARPIVRPIIRHPALMLHRRAKQSRTGSARQVSSADQTLRGGKVRARWKMSQGDVPCRTLLALLLLWPCGEPIAPACGVSRTLWAGS